MLGKGLCGSQMPHSINYAKPCYSNLEYSQLPENFIEKAPQMLHAVYASNGFY